MVSNLALRWPKTLCFMVLGPHGALYFPMKLQSMNFQHFFNWDVGDIEYPMALMKRKGCHVQKYHVQFEIVSQFLPHPLLYLWSTLPFQTLGIQTPPNQIPIGLDHRSLGRCVIIYVDSAMYGGFLTCWYPQSPPQVLIIFCRKTHGCWVPSF